METPQGAGASGLQRSPNDDDDKDDGIQAVVLAFPGSSKQKGSAHKVFHLQAQCLSNRGDIFANIKLIY